MSDERVRPAYSSLITKEIPPVVQSSGWFTAHHKDLILKIDQEGKFYVMYFFHKKSNGKRFGFPKPGALFLTGKPQSGYHTALNAGAKFYFVVVWIGGMAYVIFWCIYFTYIFQLKLCMWCFQINHFSKKHTSSSSLSPSLFLFLE